MKFEKVADAVLPGWEISLAFITPTVAKRLNKKLRGKSYTPNVLAYEVGAKHGEILICKEVARREARRYGHSSTKHVLFLFIHALLHLKGMAHGTTMERRERALLAELVEDFSRVPIHGTPHRNRNRHRHLSGEDRRRRRNPR